jgi:hypothetical protein
MCNFILKIKLYWFYIIWFYTSTNFMLLSILGYHWFELTTNFRVITGFKLELIFGYYQF